MKASLLVSSLLLVSFIPSFSDASSFERICREATRGDDYEFCVSALKGIPAEGTTSIQELAITAMGHLLANNATNDATPSFDFGGIFKCAFGLVHILNNLREALAKVEAGDIQGAIQQILGIVGEIKDCVGGDSIGTDMASPEVLTSKIKAVDVAGKILNWLIKIN